MSAGRGTPRAGAPGPDGATPGAALLRLVEVMDTLRVSCPWDARQSHESLAPYLLEECYEALEALEGGEESALRDELGDVLLQVVFHARIAAERTDGTGFSIDDVAAGIVAKLIRRHPHVFGDVQVSGPEDVKRNWDAIKAAERGGQSGAPTAGLGSVPFGQPALALAAQLQRRAERAGVPAELADLRDGAVPGGRAAPGDGAARGGRAAPGDGAAPGGRAAPGDGAVRGDGAAPGDGAARRGGAEPGARGTDLGHAGASGAGASGAGASGAGDGASGQGVSEIGAALFELVAKARAAGLDPELELRAAARAYRHRVNRWESGQRQARGTPGSRRHRSARSGPA